MGSVFKIRVAVVLPIDNQIVICRQNDRPFWVLPGGTLEPGETVEACAIRELLEELGLTISVEKLLYIGDWITPTRQVHEVYFLGRHKGGDLHQPLEANIQAVRLAPADLLLGLPLQPLPVASAIQADWPSGFAKANGRVLGGY